MRATELVPENAWNGLSSFGVFVASLGAVVVSYSLLNTQTSLKEFREGKEPSNRAAAGVAAIGFGAMVFATGYVSAAYYVGFSSMSYEAFSSLLLHALKPSIPL